MARIRKPGGPPPKPEPILWKVGKYIRLSHETGEPLSESAANQDKILDDELPAFFGSSQYELADSYIDDGTSGTTDRERREFQRMVQDVQAGRINCIVVKNLSRAFRNSANQGHFLEEFIPLYHTRFISLYQPRIDTFLDPEVVHSLEVSITGFMNEQYAYKTSADVRRTFRLKREGGQFIGAFAPYGYAKDPQDKNALVIDEEAAQVVRDIFVWFTAGGMSKAGIAKRLNELGVPNPTAYKRLQGLRYQNPCAAANDGLWNPTTVARILQDPLYIGVMRQGRQRVLSYKVHQRIAVPENEWFWVENALPPLVERELFQTAQQLHQQDTRAAPGKREVYLFSGFVRCAGCKKSMMRHSAREWVYYTCRTHREKSSARCCGHSIRLDRLERAVLAAIQQLLNRSDALPKAAAQVAQAKTSALPHSPLGSLLTQRTRELARCTTLLDDLYIDWKSGSITAQQYQRLKTRWEEQAGRLSAAIRQIEAEQKAAAENIGPANPLEQGPVLALSRGLLAALVEGIYIHAGGKVEIVFCFADPDSPGR